MNIGKRKVITADALKWLAKNKGHRCIVTSLPDMDELKIKKHKWQAWIYEACDVMIESLAEDGIIFFYQTDRRFEGEIIDKKQIISEAFLDNEYKLILNKIILKQKPGTVNLFRPTYTNLFAFSKGTMTGKATPDVVDAGKMLYKNAMGFNACKICVDFLIGKKINCVVVDPFCGKGSILKVANDMGYDSLGVDIDPKMTSFAAKL